MTDQRTRCLQHQLLRSRTGHLLIAVALAALVDTLLTVAGVAQPLSEAITTSVYPLEHPWLELPMVALTILGMGVPLAAVVLLASGWMIQRGHGLDGILLIGTFLAAQILVQALKAALREPRPYLQLPPNPLAPLYDYGYPSGHALSSSAVFGFIAVVAWERIPELRTRMAIVGLCILLIAGIGASRVYLGFHWVNDVLGGYLYGTLLVLIDCLLRRCLINRTHEA